MAEQRHTDDSIHEQGGAGRMLKRRGILAAAGAVVAGIVAKQASEPVAAAYTLMGDTSNISTTVTTISGNVGGGAVLRVANNVTTGFLGNSDGVQGYASFNGGANAGVRGVSPDSVGVSGIIPMGAPSNTQGVSGFNGSSGTNAVGVIGQSTGPGFGVFGASSGGTGVFGISTNSPGVPARADTGVMGVSTTGGTGGYFTSGSGNGVYGTTSGTGPVAGVLGTTAATLLSDQRAGTAGMSNVTGVPGVYGHATVGNTHGVIGSGANSGAGVFGINSNVVGIGVQGFNDFGPAVQGNTSAGTGVRGIATTGTGVYGYSSGGNGVYGFANAAGATTIVAGLYGTSNTTYGIIGNTTAAGYSGLTAITGTAGVAALAATSTVSNAYAAYFQGTTVVEGNFFVVSGAKSAAIPHTDGSYRAVYCVESPESWFEDFGEGKVVNGKADVHLDPDFGAIVHTDVYHVFLTPQGDTNGLHVTSRSAGGFTVQEHKGGTSSLTFSWRVVAKRKDIVGKRLAKVDLPKINTPDPNKLPKPPEALLPKKP